MTLPHVNEARFKSYFVLKRSSGNSTVTVIGLLMATEMGLSYVILPFIISSQNKKGLYLEALLK
jgi:hypothetical protein